MFCTREQISQIDIDEGLTYNEAVHKAKRFYNNATSARLFRDFHDKRALDVKDVFHHDCNFRSKRSLAEQKRHFQIRPVEDQALREMRHKRLCHQHNGKIATCERCDCSFTVNDIVQTALRTHYPASSAETEFCFPETASNKRLDKLVYELQKAFDWLEDDSPAGELQRAKRYLASNALVNVHRTTHANRCFKKGPECYANLPATITDKTRILYCEAKEFDIWSDCWGNKEKRWMFRFEPQRPVEDVFMNVHNPTITCLLGCNNNVMVGMNGRLVFYCTGYNCKPTQKEERETFENVSRVLIGILRKQVRETFFRLPFRCILFHSVLSHHRLSCSICSVFSSPNVSQEEEEGGEENLPDEIMGFKRVLAGIYSHTSTYVVAAPMAHHVALEGSRFRFSHDHCWLPAEGVLSVIDGEDMVMRFRNVEGKQIAVHKALNYLYRPLHMEDMCLYKFFQKMAFISRSRAEGQGQEYFEFLDEYACSSIEVAVYRDTAAIPAFAWTFLGSTASFQTSILDTVDETHPDYPAKEQYAKKFMILFLPLRAAEDLKVDGSYQKALQLALQEGKISDEMLEIANNIQNIHNSLNSELVDDPLLSMTHLEEAEECAPANKEDDEDPNFAACLDSIGDYFASTEQGSANLTEDATELNPRTIWKDPAEAEAATMATPEGDPDPTAMESVICFADKEPPKPRKDPVAKVRFKTTTAELNSLAMTQKLASALNSNIEKVDANGTWDSIVAFGKIAKLDREQQTAYEILAATYVLSFYEEAEENLATEQEKQAHLKRKSELRKLARRRNMSRLMLDQPLRMFVTGPAGAGKCECPTILGAYPLFCLSPPSALTSCTFRAATLLEALIGYAKAFSKNIGHNFTRATIRITALTGTAATEIGGQTSAMEYHLLSDKDNVLDSEEIREWQDTRLNIVDEVSFGGYTGLLEKLNERLGKFTERPDLLYGSSAIVFLGDFCQLPSLSGGGAIYEHENAILWEQALNCMVELKGTHRFKNCEDMKRIIPGMRDYGLTDQDRAKLNSRVVDGVNVKLPDIDKTKFASWKNVTKSQFNAAVFKDHLEKFHGSCTKDNIPSTAVVIRADAHWSKSNAPLSFNQRKILFEECPEGDCKNSSNKYFDPLLCLFYNCQLICNDNKDVANGIANGSTALFKKLHLEPGAKLVPTKMHGCWVYAVDIGQVQSIELEWHKCKFEGRFRLKPETPTCTVNFPVMVLGKKTYFKAKIKLQCLPVNLNHATTGHKLQGKSVDEIVIVEWSTNNAKKWAYVVISRVRTLDGLFLLKPIPEDIDFQPDEKYTEMMERLRPRILATPEQVADLMEEFPASPYFDLCTEDE